MKDAHKSEDNGIEWGEDNIGRWKKAIRAPNEKAV